MRKSVVLASLFLIGGCGGSKGATASSPTSTVPTPTPAPVLTVLGGDTGRPIAGAQVVVSGVPLVSDSAGQVRPANPANGALIDIIAAGYLDRQTQVRLGSETLSRFTLWPRRPLSQFDEDYTRLLVYTSSNFGTEGASNPLRRLGTTTTQIRVILPPQLLADSSSSFFHQYAADTMNTALSGLLRYTVGGEASPGALSVPVSVDSAGSSCTSNVAAYATIGTNSAGNISFASINYCDIRWAREGRVILHEMGHTLGLRHSALRSDVMYPGSAPDVFSDRELLVMRLIYQRPSGNAFPDNDRSTSGLAATRTETIVCNR